MNEKNDTNIGHKLIPSFVRALFSVVLVFDIVGLVGIANFYDVII